VCSRQWQEHLQQEMYNRFDLSVYTVVACFSMMVCQQTGMLRYIPVVSPSGVEQCAVDEPSVITSGGQRSMLQCAVECMASSCCIMYQMNATSSQCQLFSYLPRNYQNATGCNAFIGTVSTLNYIAHIVSSS
jgi:hypothetical protein